MEVLLIAMCQNLRTFLWKQSSFDWWCGISSSSSNRQNRKQGPVVNNSGPLLVLLLLLLICHPIVATAVVNYYSPIHPFTHSYPPPTHPSIGINVKTDIDALKVEVPHIVVGTPGRVLDLATKRNALDLSKVKHFVLDECDRLLAEIDMRKDVQSIFKVTPYEKQVMMYSATLDKEIRPVCRKFCQSVSLCLSISSIVIIVVMMMMLSWW